MVRKEGVERPFLLLLVRLSSGECENLLQRLVVLNTVAVSDLCE
jgi:hypothetical protein